MRKKWVIFLLIVNAMMLSASIFCLVLTGQNVSLFNRQEIEVRQEGDSCFILTARSGKEYGLDFGGTSVKIVDSYAADREDCLDIISALRMLDTQDKFTRDNSDLMGELRLHKILYSLGIARKSTRDCDLDYTSDKRWYVETTSKLIGWMGV